MENNEIKEAKLSKIKYKEQEYELVFNLNVMQAIQKRYGTFDTWLELVAPEEKEADIEAFIFGMCQMINEGIDIQNEDEGSQIPFVSEKQTGRIITDYGLKEATALLQNTVVEATKDDEPKNA